MATQTVYPFGPNGPLPSGLGIVNDRKTGGADKPWSAEQGKLACQDIDKNTEDIFEMFSTDINLASYTTQTGWTIPNTNLWQHVTGASASNYGCILVPITPGLRYRVYTHTTNQVIALLASDSMVAGNSPDFCDGYNGRISVVLGDVFDFVAPADAAYLYMLRKSNGTSIDGTAAYSEVEIPKVGEDIALLQGEVNTINSQPYGEDTPVTDKWLLQKNGTWAYTNTANAQSCYMFPITPGEKYRIIGGTRGAGYALLASNSMVAGQSADFCENEARKVCAAGHTVDFTAPSDAAYCYITHKSSSGTYDSYLSIPKAINDQLSEAGIGVDARDGFATAPEYYAWLKSEQYTKLKWTPLKGTIQKASSTGKFAANTEQTGIPYSSVSEYDKRIGFDVSLHTFMTALHNPYSVLYTECVRYAYSQSAYGRQYYGPENSGPFYGGVCSNFADYCVGMPVPYITAQLRGVMGNLVQSGVVSPVYDQSANGARRGDIIVNPNHTMYVKDVWRKNGVVTKVLVSEEAQPKARDKDVMTASEFNTFLGSNGNVLVRYNELYKNIKYEPSPYVAVGDEIPQAVVYNDDICTFAGDKAAFIEGELIYIHCLNLAYPQMELYKGDTLLMTITLASDSRAAKTSDELAYAVNLSNDNLTYGKYKCRLKNGDTYSDYTYFEIINAEVTVNGDIAEYSSANGVAVYWYWTEYHSTDGNGMYNAKALPGQASGTIDVSDRKEGYPLLKVLFRGDYGNVAARYLEQ